MPENPRKHERGDMVDPSSHASSSSTRSRYRGAAKGLQYEDVHLLDYVKVLHKRRWTALGAFVLVVTAMTVYSVTVTPQYVATARLLIDPDNVTVVEFQPVDELQAESDYYQTQYELLRSRTLARKTLQEAELWNDFESTGEEGWSPWSVFSFASSLLGATGESPPAAESAPSRKPIERLLSAIDVAPVSNSRLVDLRVRSADPQLAAKVANAHARAYVDQNIELRLLASKEASGWLKEQLEEQRRRVEESEWALQRYLEEQGTVTFEDNQNIVIQRLEDLSSAVTGVRTERIGIETRYNRLRAVRDDREALYSFPAIINNEFIQQQRLELSRLEREYVELSENLGERHPEILRVRSAIDTVRMRIDEEIQRVADSIEDEYLAVRTQEASLVAALEAQKAEALSSNQKEIQYTVLSREVESNREVYDALLQRVKETDVSGELQTNNIRIIDSAEVPESPASPRKGLNLLLALIAGGMLGVGLAFVFEYVDTRIKTPDEVKVYLGLPSLGIIPVISPKAYPSGGSLLVSNGAPPLFRESVNRLRTNLVFTTGAKSRDQQPAGRRLLVTSTGAGEGKTMVASNLAIALAELGQRVLLIDADLRLPRVHEIFEQPREAGLSDSITGAVDLGRAMRPTRVRGLRTLPAGTTPPNPSELLGSPRFQAFLQALQSHFDWIVIDSPPVLAVTDASVIAPAVDRVLFVVGAEMTTREAAQEAIEELENVEATFAGVVLNRVPLERNSYYYSRYYRREYGSYHSANAVSLPQA